MSTMELQIVEKGQTFEIKDKATNQNITKAYIGAGWDMPEGGGSVDLDLVAACLTDGKLKSQTRLVYFGDKSEPGVQLSADNTTGAGDGDDENITFDLDKVEADVNSIAIGLVAYRGADLSTAKSIHFRACNGMTPSSPEIFKAPMQLASPGDTVLHALTLSRTPTGWTMTNVNSFYKKGSGTQAVEGFAKLFQ